MRPGVVVPEKRTSKKRQQELAKAVEDAPSSDEDDDASLPLYTFTYAKAAADTQGAAASSPVAAGGTPATLQ